jgi:hypothetical protein
MATLRQTLTPGGSLYGYASAELGPHVRQYHGDVEMTEAEHLAAHERGTDHEHYRAETGALALELAKKGGVIDFVRVYICVDDEAGPEESVDVTPERAAELLARGLCYEPEDGPGTLWTYIGKGRETWDHLESDRQPT